MPAIELNTQRADADYDKVKQAALFKLWLLVTTSQYTSNKATKVFDTTREAQAFAEKLADQPDTTIYYVDLEKLAAEFKPILKFKEVQSVFHLLQLSTSQPTLQSAADLFWYQGAQTLGYGHGGCTPMSDILALRDGQE